MGNILASSISNVPHLAAFDEMAEARMAAINAEAVLVYLIDIVNVNALPFLASQFDVLGHRGYAFAQTEEDKREVIKKAIELHRYKGTPWSVKEALKAIGYYDAVIQERLTSVIYYDGEHFYSGGYHYGPGHWAEFRVIVDLGNDSGIDDQAAAEAVILINEYKPTRSRLVDVSYQGTIQEYLTEMSESLVVNIEYNISETMYHFFNAEFNYSGAIFYSGLGEDLTVNIVS